MRANYLRLKLRNMELEQSVQRKVLVVDDIAFNRRVLEKILSKQNFDITKASSGEEALMRVEKSIPDLILLDLKMPGINGIEVCKKLKADRRFRHIPIMFLTASNELDDMRDAFQAGAIDYITKPFIAAELHARVTTQINALDQAERMMKKVEEQQEMIHILSHDLKNPIVACRGLVELTEDGDVSFGMVSKTLIRTLDQCVSIIELVRKRGLMDETASMPDMQAQDLLSMVKESLYLFERNLRDKQIQVSLSIPAGIEVYVERVSFVNVVLSNLLSNAVKYSYADSQVEVEAAQKDSYVELLIRDHGMGIPQYMVPVIFDPHKMTRRPGTAKEQGTGYGMPLVKKLVESYGGRIGIESVARSEDMEQAGTTVVLHLPLPPPADA